MTAVQLPKGFVPPEDLHVGDLVQVSKVFFDEWGVYTLWDGQLDPSYEPRLGLVVRKVKFGAHEDPPPASFLRRVFARLPRRAISDFYVDVLCSRGLINHIDSPLYLINVMGRLERPSVWRQLVTFLRRLLTTSAGV